MTKDEEIQSILKSNSLQIEAQNRIIDRLQANQREIAAAFDCKPSDGTDLVEAAKLLKREAAVAPELLAALQRVRDAWGGKPNYSDGFHVEDVVAAAILKAEGRTA